MSNLRARVDLSDHTQEDVINTSTMDLQDHGIRLITS